MPLSRAGGAWKEKTRKTRKPKKREIYSVGRKFNMAN